MKSGRLLCLALLAGRAAGPARPVSLAAQPAAPLAHSAPSALSSPKGPLSPVAPHAPRVLVLNRELEQYIPAFEAFGRREHWPDDVCFVLVLGDVVDDTETLQEDEEHEGPTEVQSQRLELHPECPTPAALSSPKGEVTTWEAVSAGLHAIWPAADFQIIVVGAQEEEF